MKFSLVKLPQNRRFTYIPRYYNQEKEERLKKLEKYKQLSGGGSQLRLDGVKERITANFTKRKRADRKSFSLRLLVIVSMLLIVSYVIWSRT